MKKGFSLLEVMVGAIILAVMLGGLIATFSFARGYVAHSNRRVVAVNIARNQLNSLYSDVRADEWSDATNPLNPSFPTGAPEAAPPALEGVNYTVDYTVTAPGGQDYRIVEMTVSFDSL